MSEGRYERQISFFGADGQTLIAATKFTVVGLGGTGSHVVQQLAFLGAKDFRLIDGDRVEVTNLNRLIGATAADGVSKALKVDVAERLIRSLQEDARVEVIPQTFVSHVAFSAAKQSDVVFGCVDRDSVRLILNEFCQAYEIPYIDIATGIDRDNPREFGGRVHYSVAGESCVYCDQLLEQDEIRFDFSTDQQRRIEEEIYGVSRAELADSGPSVVSLNGLLASAAVMECLVGLTSLRDPKRLLKYRGFWGTLATTNDAPASTCPYCKGLRGARDKADLERWIREGFGGRI